MFRKLLLGGAFGVLTTIVYRVGKQNIFATNDQSQGETDSLASRHKNGKFSKKKNVEKSIRSQQSLVEARATTWSQFDCPTNITWTRTQEVIVKKCLYILHIINHNINKVLDCIIEATLYFRWY